MKTIHVGHVALRGISDRLASVFTVDERILEVLQRELLPASCRRIAA